MKRIVDVFTNEWTPEIVWTYIVNLEGNENHEQLDHDVVDASAFKAEALRLAIEENRGNETTLIAKVRE